MSPMHGKTSGVQRDVLPGHTRDFLRWLDEHIPVPQAAVEDFADEKNRLRLAYNVGQRELVDVMKARFEREQTEQKEAG